MKIAKRLVPTRERVILAVIGLATSMIVFGAGVKIGYELLNDQVECFDDYAYQNYRFQIDRTAASEAESNASKRLWLIYAEAAGLVKDDPTKPPPPEEEERLQRELVDALLDYKRIVEQAEKDRAEAPIPEPPREVC